MPPERTLQPQPQPGCRVAYFCQGQLDRPIPRGPLPPYLAAPLLHLVGNTHGADLRPGKHPLDGASGERQRPVRVSYVLKKKNGGAQGGGESAAVIQRGPREEEKGRVWGPSVRREQGGGELPPVLASPLREEERAAKDWGRTFRNIPYVGPEMPGRRRGISGNNARPGRRRGRRMSGEGPCGTSPMWVRRCQGGGEASPEYNDRSGRRRERPYLRSVSGGSREEESSRRS